MGGLKRVLLVEEYGLLIGGWETDSCIIETNSLAENRHQTTVISTSTVHRNILQPQKTQSSLLKHSATLETLQTRQKRQGSIKEPYPNLNLNPNGPPQALQKKSALQATTAIRTQPKSPKAQRTNLSNQQTTAYIQRRNNFPGRHQHLHTSRNRPHT